MNQLVLKGFLPTSFIDWEGKVASVVFVPQCNFRCPFCQNAGIVLSPDSHASVPLSEIESFLREHDDFIDGVCLSGGEPALHHDRGLYEFIRLIKQHGLLVKFDTNGAYPAVIRKLLAEKLVDHIAMDLKGPLTEKYDLLAGVKVDLAKIKESIGLIMASGLPYEFRTTVVPGLLAEPDIRAMAQEIAGAKLFALQQFVPENCLSPELRTVKPYAPETLLTMVETAKKFVPNTILRGV